MDHTEIEKLVDKEIALLPSSSIDAESRQRIIEIVENKQRNRDAGIIDLEEEVHLWYEARRLGELAH